MAVSSNGIRGKMVDMYDIFVDWPGRLGREMPGLVRALQSVGANRVLDVGCGTGQHVHALRQAGYEAFGADVSQEMIDRAVALTGQADWFCRWSLGGPPRNGIGDLGPFDAIVCMGNVWPHLLSDAEVGGAAHALFEMLRPGGLLIVGMKAMALRQADNAPYLPLLKREHEGRPYYFVRVMDFDIVAGPAHESLAEMHMIVVSGDTGSQPEAELHEVRRLRLWSPEELPPIFTAAGFDDVKVSARLDDPDLKATGEDVFVRAVRR